MRSSLVRFQHTLRSRLQGDAGQGALEYIGILIIIGVIVAAVIVVFQGQQGTITSAVSTAIQNFLSGGG